MKVKVVSVIMALTMCASILTGCGNAVQTTEETLVMTETAMAETETENPTIIEDDAVPKAEESDTRIIVDHRGKEVEIPAKVERIVITSITPIPSVYALLGEDMSKIVGISPSAKSAAEKSILADIHPEILDIPTDFMANNEVNIEEVLAMEPDVVIYNISKAEEGEKLEAAGIPAVAFSTTKGDSPIEILEGWVSLLADILDTEQKSQEIIQYGNDILDMLAKRLEEAGDTLEKPEVLYIYAYDNGVVTTTGSTHHGERWANATGAINVGGGIETQKYEVSMEQIYEWNPDIIYIASSVSYLPEDFYNNAIEGADWSSVQAVQDGKVYRCPMGTYHWYPPSADSPLMLIWQAQHNQPELFADIDLEEMVVDYFKRFYNVELTEEELEKIFNPAR